VNFGHAGFNVPATMPGRNTPQERRLAALKVVELAGFQSGPARDVLDMLGILDPLRNDQETP
jgi:hypothetical protein